MFASEFPSRTHLVFVDDSSDNVWRMLAHFVKHEDDNEKEQEEKEEEKEKEEENISKHEDEKELGDGTQQGHQSRTILIVCIAVALHACMLSQPMY